MKIKNKSSFDGYLIADIATVITVVLFVLFVSKKTKFEYFTYGAAATAITLMLQALLGKAQVKNKSSKPIVVKDEESEDIDVVNPGEVAVDIDGATILHNNVTVNKTVNNLGESNKANNVSIEMSRQISSISQPFVSVGNYANSERRICVYKIPNGVHATVNKDDKVKVSSIWGGLVYRVGGGLITSPPDRSWNKMFGINN